MAAKLPDKASTSFSEEKPGRPARSKKTFLTLGLWRSKIPASES
jgi:hypothetical protein